MMLLILQLDQICLEIDGRHYGYQLYVPIVVYSLLRLVES